MEGYTYYFTYDWRKTPQLIAEELNGFVETAKNEAIAKNEGKPVIGRRQINKLLNPYILKKQEFFYNFILFSSASF